MALTRIEMPRIVLVFLPVAFAAFLTIAAVPMAAADDVVPVGKDHQADRNELKDETALLKKGVSDLNDKIGEDTKRLETLSDPETARKTVADLQAKLSELLAATSDNGRIEVLGKKVLDTENAWLADVKTHHFAPEREAFLEDQFRAIIDNTRKTLSGITKVRHELTTSLKQLQTEQDYLEELARVDQGKQMVNVLQDLLKNMSGASDRLNVIINGVPGT